MPGHHRGQSRSNAFQFVAAASDEEWEHGILPMLQHQREQPKTDEVDVISLRKQPRRRLLRRKYFITNEARAITGCNRSVHGDKTGCNGSVRMLIETHCAGYARLGNLGLLEEKKKFVNFTPTRREL